MRVDARLEPGVGVGAAARELEAAGYDGLWVREARHDPFVSAALAGAATGRVRLGTAIAVAFARSPMSLAYQANDLMLHTGGRFALGLGGQVRAHVERRFAMPWGRPAHRMEEYVRALRAIWAAWATGEPLDFEGEFYRHTLMTPAFSPGPNPHGAPPILLAAVGERMTETAGRIADGLIVHGFTTPGHLRSVALPAFERGLAASGRTRADAEVYAPVLVVTGETPEEFAEAAAGVRGQLAFYGSTPAYRPVLDGLGRGDLADDLHRLSRGPDPARWDRMADLVDDDVLSAFAVVAEPSRVAAELRRRYAGLADRVSLYTVAGTRPSTLARVAADLRG